MNPQEKQQVAARDDKWVPFSERVKTSSTNIKLETTVPQKEETFQVVIDLIKNSTCFKAFTISADVPEIFMTILDICPRVEGVDFIDVPDDDTALIVQLVLVRDHCYIRTGFSCGTIEGIQSLLTGIFIYALMMIDAFAIVSALRNGETFSFSRVYSLYKERSAAHVTATVLTVTTLQEFSLSSHKRPQQQETMTNRVRHLATSARKRNVVLVEAFFSLLVKEARDVRGVRASCTTERGQRRIRSQSYGPISFCQFPGLSESLVRPGLGVPFIRLWERLSVPILHRSSSD
ncbi:hypothetical protein Tco_0963215 [Tanacetum coccineum]